MLTKTLGHIFSPQEWGAEGYEAWCVEVRGNKKFSREKVGGLVLSHGGQEPPTGDKEPLTTSLLLFNFIKSALTVNPSMVRHSSNNACYFTNAIYNVPDVLSNDIDALVSRIDFIQKREPSSMYFPLNFNMLI